MNRKVPAPPAAATKPAIGIGVLVLIETNSLRVQEVAPGGGAEAAGIVVGDRIVGVDGVTVRQLGPQGAMDKMLGQAGIQVAVTLFRNNAPVTINVQRIALKRKLSLDFGEMSEVLERKISP
jgi:carboxyl-terminal processing protease